MLDPWIIEEIRRREEERARRESEQPALEVNEPPVSWERRESGSDDDAPRRGVVVIDLGA